MVCDFRNKGYSLQSYVYWYINFSSYINMETNISLSLISVPGTHLWLSLKESICSQVHCNHCQKFNRNRAESVGDPIGSLSTLGFAFSISSMEKERNSNQIKKKIFF